MWRTMLLALSLAQNLFTTDRTCSSWEHRHAWLQMGYSPRCLDNAAVRSLVHRVCKVRMPLIIQYADVARLIVLYESGGWYVDSDVVPTKRCIHTRAFANTTFGLESNFGSQREADGYGMLQHSLALWAIFGWKGAIRLLEMAKVISGIANETARQPGQSLESYVHHTTGPTAQTKAWGGPVLPVNVFGCGQAHSGSPGCRHHTCWGCHRFSGRWRHE
jgi:hypothetical protein